MPKFSASTTAHTLRFRIPAGTSRGVLREKTVYFLRLHAAGRTGTGECAPWRGLSLDATPEFETRLAAVCRRISAGEHPADIRMPRLPALQFGLEMAWLDWRNGGTGILFDTPFTRGETRLPTHGLIWMDSADGLRRQIEAKIAAGFTVIKMKIGAIDFADECAVLADTRRAHPAKRIALRLDANGAFSADDALAKLETLAQFGIEFLEQPIKPGQWRAMSQLCAASPIPIVPDEELIGHHTPAERRRLLDAIRPQGIVLKPALLGGFATCDDWIAAATERGIRWWANSALESNVGLSAICQWVSARAPDRTHGLGTGKLYENNVAGRVENNGQWLIFHRRMNAMQKIKLSPQTPIAGLPNCKVEDFWAWAYSDILSNRNRAIFAEFLVTAALNLTQTPRVEWDAVDLRYKGKTIEVKSSGFLQSWEQNKLSSIVFDIAPKLGWDEKTNTSANVPVRIADCYIFCLLIEKDLDNVDVLNLEQWRFYVLDTDLLNTTFNNQKSVVLNKIESLSPSVEFEQLQATIDSILFEN